MSAESRCMVPVRVRARTTRSDFLQPASLCFTEQPYDVEAAPLGSR
jgi:hypothetical protein